MPELKVRNYKNIKAWQLADQLVMEVYKAVKNFPRNEVYGMTSQLKRAVVSVPTNIAEGASRQHKRDYVQFLYIARGSLSETEYLLGLSSRLGFMDNSMHQKVDQLCNETKATLFGLIQFIESNN